MARIIFFAILFYLAYRFVFDLLVPVYKTTKHVRKQFNDLNNQARANQSFQQQEEPIQRAPQGTPKAGEYIDFEEIK